MLANDEQHDPSEPIQSSLPSIRELFGIRASDKLDSLIASPQRPSRSNNPPPSSFNQKPTHGPQYSPRPAQERRLEARGPIRSNSFSSIQLPSSRGRPMSPRSSSSSGAPMFQNSSSTSPTLSRRRQSPSNLASSLSLPPLTTALPGFIPANRGRAVSDTETFTRGPGLSPSSDVRTIAPAPHSSSRQSVAALHPSLQQHARPRSPHTEPIDHRGHVGRSPVYPTTSGRSHAHSIISQSSAHSDEPASSHAHWSDRSRSSLDHPQTSSSLEFAPHAFSSVSLAARQASGLYSSSSSAPITIPSAYSDASSQTSPSRGHERVPPSSFHQPAGAYTSSSRPRSANSSEGDESSKSGGFGKYECEYCSKRFNRPSSLRIHINTHTGAKPFQCPFPTCGRRFSVMSNMRRHARTHGNMLPLASDDSSHQRGSMDDPTKPSSSSTSPNGLLLSTKRLVGSRRGSDGADPGMEVDELEGDFDDEMDTDAGGGSSESENYPISTKPRGRHPSSDHSKRYHPGY